MNEQLEQLELQLEEIPLAKRVALYIVILLSFLYMSWTIFGEEMFNDIETKEENIMSLEKKLQRNSIKSLDRALKKVKKDILIAEEKVNTLNFKNHYIVSKLESIGFIFYDKKGMAKILDDTLKSSLKNRIDIAVIESTPQDKIFVPYIYNKESIHIQGSGSFGHIMSLIQYIDSFNTLVKINSIVVDIDEESKTNFDLNISKYGVKL